MDLKSYLIRWKKTQNKGYYAVQGHRGRHQLKARMQRAIGVARWCKGARGPQGGENFFSGPKLQRKVVSAPPRQSVQCTPKAEQESKFLRKLDVDGRKGCLGSFSVFWGRRLKKVNFLGGKKSAPQINPGYAYEKNVVNFSLDELWSSSSSVGKEIINTILRYVTFRAWSVCLHVNLMWNFGVKFRVKWVCG